MADETETAECTDIDVLNIDEIAVVFGYLSWREILLARICKKSFVPPTYAVRNCVRQGEFFISCHREYGALDWMAKSLSNLQQMTLIEPTSTTQGRLSGECLCFEDGEDPFTFHDPRTHQEVTGGPHDDRIGIIPITRFRRLRNLTVYNVWLNGHYPQLFRFSHLKELNLISINLLKCDLQIMCFSPVLEYLQLIGVPHLVGDINVLGKIKGTLHTIRINDCGGIYGEVDELFDFQNLKVLNLDRTPVTGDLRNLKRGDFPMLRHLSLPSSIFGGSSFPFKRVVDAPEVMNALCLLKSHSRTEINSGFENAFGVESPSWHLSNQSSDHYPLDIFSLLHPPFQIEIVQAGPRIGWRWTNKLRHGCCETNWVGEEPYLEGEEHENYMKGVQRLQANVQSFRGFMKRPPTAEEYQMMSTHW